MNIKDSIFMNKSLKLISIINKFYKNSILFKILDKILKFMVESLIISTILRNLKNKNYKYYSNGSFIISAIFLFVEKVFKFLKIIYKKIYEKYKKSFIYLFVKKYIKPLKEINIFLQCLFSFTLGFLIFRILLEIIDDFNIINLSFYIFCSLMILMLDNNYIIKTISKSFLKKMLIWIVKDS